MISFFLIQGGLAAGMNALAYLGFILVIVSMLYSPVKVFIIDRKKIRRLP